MSKSSERGTGGGEEGEGPAFPTIAFFTLSLSLFLSFSLSLFPSLVHYLLKPIYLHSLRACTLFIFVITKAARPSPLSPPFILAAPSYCSFSSREKKWSIGSIGRLFPWSSASAFFLSSSSIYPSRMHNTVLPHQRPFFNTPLQIMCYMSKEESSAILLLPMRSLL